MYRTLIALFQMSENLESICRARNKEPCRANAETTSCPASELAEIFSLRLHTCDWFEVTSSDRRDVTSTFFFWMSCFRTAIDLRMILAMLKAYAAIAREFCREDMKPLR